MTTLTVTEASTRLYGLVDEAAATNKPITIKGKKASAVLVSGQDLESIQETLNLLAVPGMLESIRKGFQIPTAECAEEPGW